MNKVREGYKITELGEIPSDWNIMKLSEIAEIVMGQSPDSSSYNYIEDGVAFFQGKTEFGRINPVVKKWCNNPTKISKPLDILISVRAPVGDVNINNIEACIGRGLGAIRATSNSNYKYLYYAIQKYNNQLKNKSQGSTFEAINSNDLKGLKLPIPHIDEQEKIALILSTVDEEIDNVDALIEKNKELKKGLMQTLLTKGIGHTKFKKTEIGEIPEEWELCLLESVTERIIVGLATSVTEYYRDSGVPIIRNMNIKSGYFDDSSMLYLDEQFANSMLGKNVKTNDVITVHTGSNIGLTCVVPKDYNGAHTFTTLITTTKSNLLHHEYLMYSINSEYGVNEINRLQVGGGKSNLNVKEFKLYRISVPSIEEQVKIVSILKEVDKKINQYSKNKQFLEELKKGLMQQLLTGNIKV